LLTLLNKFIHMGIVDRKIRHKEEIRASILEAAWQMVITEGWQYLSIRKIADAIEYSIPVIYSHFENKDSILLEFTKEGFEKLSEALIAAKEQHDDPTERLKQIGHAYWDFAFNHKEYYQLMFGLGIPACETVNQIPEMKNMTTVLIGSIKDTIATGSNTDVDYFLKFHTYWSILHGLVSIQMIEKDGSREPIKKLILDDALTGFIKSLLN
jgi:AcrR family transcriptional regulator